MMISAPARTAAPAAMRKTRRASHVAEMMHAAAFKTAMAEVVRVMMVVWVVIPAEHIHVGRGNKRICIVRLAINNTGIDVTPCADVTASAPGRQDNQRASERP